MINWLNVFRPQSACRWCIRFVLGVVLSCGALATAANPALAGGIPDGPNVQITDAGLGDETIWGSPDLAASGENVYATWTDTRPARYDLTFGSVYFAKSTDGGKSWGSNLLISDLEYDEWVETPKVAAFPNGTVVIIWQTYRRWGDEYAGDVDSVNDVRMALSTDNGETFTRSTILDGYDQDGDFNDPSIAVDPTTGHTYFLVHDYRISNDESNDGYEMKLSRFDVETSTFTIQPKSINDVQFSGRGNDSDSFGLGRDDHPAIDLVARDGIVCAAWEDRRERFAIFGTCSEDNGETFSPSFNISGADGKWPYIALGPDGDLYAIYSFDSDNDNNILLRRSPDLGETWEDERTITTEDQYRDDVGSRSIAVDANGQVLVAWTADNFSNGDVILSTSLDQGVTFGHQRIDDDEEQSAEPISVRLVTSGTGTDTRAYLAWKDDRIDYDNKLWSQPVILDGIGPTVPGTVQATGEDNSILLTWEPSTDATGIARYRVYRATAAAGPFVEIAPLGAYGTFYRDVELTNGESYFYQIAAMDGTGNTGVRSEPQSASAEIGTALSASGTIAFKDGENIKLLDLPALDNPLTPTQGGQPYFSADGQRLYYYTSNSVSSKLIAGGGEQIHMQDTDFAGAYDITADGNQIGALFSRNFTTVDGTLCYVLEPKYLDQALPRFTDEYNRTYSVALSSTGKWLAYDYAGFCTLTAFGISSPTDFCLVNTETSEKNCINGADIDAPDFAASGSQIVFAASKTGQKEIWSAEVQDDGSLAKYVQITRGPANQPSTEPAYSSNGEWIIFQRDVDTSEGEDFQLYVVKADGSSLRPLNMSGKYAAWHNGAAGATQNPNPNSNPNPNTEPVGSDQNEKTFLPFVNQ